MSEAGRLPLSLSIGLVAFILSPYSASPIDELSYHKDSPAQEEMVLIPGGEFIMGASGEEVEEVVTNFGHRGDFDGYDFEAEKPRRVAYLRAFYIDRHEVTNAEYKRFIDAAGYRPPRYWTGDSYPPEKGDNPVILVSWFDSMAYCSWKGKRLPTEEEWEKAARGPDGRVYPWGNEFDPDKVVTAEYVLKYFRSPGELLNYAAPVDAFRGDRSPYGVYDMSGNVMEWTGSWYDSGETRVVKGASWVNLGARGRSSAREGVLPDYVSHILGFRCAKDSDSWLEAADAEAKPGMKRIEVL